METETRSFESLKLKSFGRHTANEQQTPDLSKAGRLHGPQSLSDTAMGSEARTGALTSTVCSHLWYSKNILG